MPMFHLLGSFNLDYISYDLTEMPDLCLTLVKNVDDTGLNRQAVVMHIIFEAEDATAALEFYDDWYEKLKEEGRYLYEEGHGRCFHCRGHSRAVSNSASSSGEGEPGWLY